MSFNLCSCTFSTNLTSGFTSFWLCFFINKLLILITPFWHRTYACVSDYSLLAISCRTRPFCLVYLPSMFAKRLVRNFLLALRSTFWSTLRSFSQNSPTLNSLIFICDWICESWRLLILRSWSFCTIRMDSIWLRRIDSLSAF